MINYLQENIFSCLFVSLFSTFHILKGFAVVFFASFNLDRQNWLRFVYAHFKTCNNLLVKRLLISLKYW